MRNENRIDFWSNRNGTNTLALFQLSKLEEYYYILNKRMNFFLSNKSSKTLKESFFIIPLIAYSLNKDANTIQHSELFETQFIQALCQLSPSLAKKIPENIEFKKQAKFYDIFTKFTCEESGFEEEWVDHYMKINFESAKLNISYKKSILNQEQLKAIVETVNNFFPSVNGKLKKISDRKNLKKGYEYRLSFKLIPFCENVLPWMGKLLDNPEPKYAERDIMQLTY